MSSNSDVRSTSHIEIGTVGVSVSPEESKPAITLDSKIKWVVTTYIMGCIMYCMGDLCERLVFALSNISGHICMIAPFTVYVRVITDGLFFSFYLVRVTVLLQRSAFEVSKWCQYFLWIAPIITYGTAVIALGLYSQLNHCIESELKTIAFILLAIACHFFWDISLFFFLVYCLHKVIFVYVYVCLLLFFFNHN
ncbi:hypothetical protein RFI_26775 [Reticulomyxa filosa]|uniref:Transmembrane protein n=1 Tax=Reticulomyxa filosa TaxID=46433 RepID=X6MC22_RETFI|nr:hypothetical protein RFI_26775 [Reticulomyxa filosa]|eukprot:ETO10600.1 hypothetical protein RFI_26775 [Reticulomyxa filosa]